jgi:hypothetical protein
VARTVTLLELRTWARQLSDTENDPNITDAELTSLANRHTTELYDVLVDAGPPEFYSSTASVSVTPGVSSYALAANFRTLLDVYVQESSTELRRIRPMGPGERARFQAPTASSSVTVEYIPAATLLSADSDTLDGVSGWEELIANLMARDVLVKRKHDPSIVMSTIGRLEARIATRSRNRDRGNAKRVTDLDEQVTNWFPLLTSSLQAYRLRAGNLELYEPISRLP